MPCSLIIFFLSVLTIKVVLFLFILSLLLLFFLYFSSASDFWPAQAAPSKTEQPRIGSKVKRKAASGAASETDRDVSGGV